MDQVLCILQAYAAQIIMDCDKCNEEFLRKFLEADQAQIDNVTTTLQNYVLTMECRTCGNC